MNKQLEKHKEKCINENKPITKLVYATAIDQHWKLLQSKDKFFLSEPVLGSQLCGYSDNNCSVTHQTKKIDNYNKHKSKNV
jgi:hypothetical protein